MTNSEKFTAAHKLAKTYEGNYRACFALALKGVNEMIKESEFDLEYKTESYNYQVSIFGATSLINEIVRLSNTPVMILNY
jgi:hypothetical protein